ncbi:PLD-like domain protein [Bordetella pertussis STO1-CHOC-0017]|nr:PLD-like domain protein [Bordetella pertussis STO1-CHOC-0017]
MPRLLSRIRAARARAAALLALAGCAILLGACTLPPPVDRTASHALDATQARATPLGQGVGELADTHPGLSGFHVLGDAQDAFAARMLLARAATRTLDVQYYIWRNDMTGTLLLQALHAAAERGVRMRLLLDDNGISGLDDALAALDAHPNAEVRLFNPFPTRSFKALGYLTDFSRLNRRMHNKSFTVDNQATIIGGRNIGDEYFGATDGVLFADLDVLAVGPVVGDVSAEFDAYWASESAWPAGPLLPAPGAQTLRALAERAARIEQDPAAGDYMSALRELPFIRELMAGRLPLQWAPARMVSDDPAKGLGKAPPAGLLTQQLRNILGEPRRTLDLVSPYFVPAEAGTQAFAALARGGAQVRVLTNALEATDVAVVHSGYAKRRKALLPGGRAALRNAAQLRRAQAAGQGPIRQLRVQPARQDLRRRRRARLHRLVQLRSALGQSQHRTGLRDRKPRHGAPHRRHVRPGYSRRHLRGAPGRRRQPVLAGTARRRHRAARQRAGRQPVAALQRVAVLAAAARAAAVGALRPAATRP